ncbi:sensor domain-containing diguanylate cyclase [Salinimonas sediminis]|uniref:diguanylate cyclase n=1 Tax=Salinimonas sediminis TaxID=2303538 RepID=A0A346NI38_9ALTE|nr:sensor domain-containing diguanylate cyclase [Salinimonas sediminis]AXR05195.1 GGDEF domain-containing protein [Salinimonas sediminis]
MQKYSLLSSAPHRLQYGILAVLSLSILAGSIWVLQIAQTPSIPSYGFLGVYGTSVFIFELISAILLFAHYRQTKLLTFALLSMAYLWVALLAPFQIFLLTDSLGQFSLVTASNGDAAWLWIAWHIGFPVLVAAAMLVNGDYSLKVRRVWLWAAGLFGTQIAVATLLLLATLLSWFALPTLISPSRDFSDSLSLVYGPLVMFSCALALTIVVVKGKFENVIYSWLAVAMLAMLCESVVVIYSGSRFSYGWYAARVLNIISSAAVVVSLLIENIKLQYKVVEQNSTLKRMATMDELSGLANRRELDERLKAEIQRAMRERTPISLILADVDRFKKFNDNHGHLVGDLCLKHVASCLQRNILRHTDLAARYGGEEFAILLPNTHEEDAADLAEHVRKTIAYSPIVMDNGKILSVTASFGVATLIPNAASDATELLRTADSALYHAKESGRNCVQRPPQSWHSHRDELEQKISANARYLRSGTAVKSIKAG